MKSLQPYIIFISGLIALSSSLNAQPANSTEKESLGKVIELPKITITETLPPPEKWLHAQIDGFEILSNASEAKTNDLLKGFQKFRRSLQLIRPMPMPQLVSSSIIICGDNGKFKDFTPDRLRDDGGLASLFLRDREQAVIVLDFESRTITPSDFLKNAGYTETAINHHRQLCREYLQWLLVPADYSPPRWLIEGITKIAMDLEFFGGFTSGGWINLGKLDSTQGIAAAPVAGMDLEAIDSMIEATTDSAQFMVSLHNRELLPMGEFFAVSADQLANGAKFDSGIWAEQAYAFVHMCMYKRDGKYEKPFATFAKRLANEPLSEPLFKECFGMSYKEMDEELQAYIARPVYRYRHLKLTKEQRPTADDVVFREATQSEVGRIKGDAQRLAGRRTEAFTSLNIAYARGERAPRLIGALGTEEQFAGHGPRARKFLEAAVKLGTDLPSTYTALARLRLDEAKANPATSGGQLSLKQVVPVFDLLIKARAMTPALPETYEIMAETWMLSAAPPTVENLNVLAEGVMLFQSNAKLCHQTAQLYSRTGDNQSAADLARLGLRNAKNDATRSQFEALLSTLPPPAPVPAQNPPLPPPSSLSPTSKTNSPQP